MSGALGALPLVPKPPGEVNRPSHGYNLKTFCIETLHWDPDELLRVEVSATGLVACPLLTSWTVIIRFPSG